MPGASVPHPVTPDGRYFVVRGRLWRCSNPNLDPALRQRLTRELMQAMSAKRAAMRAADNAGREHARLLIDSAKRALGERGAVWWTDDGKDFNRRMAVNTPYAEWYSAICTGAEQG